MEESSWRKDLRRSGLKGNRGYRDQPLNIIASPDNVPEPLSQTDCQSSQPSVVVQRRNNHFGLSSVSEFPFPSDLAQSSIGGRQGSNACALISVSISYSFMKNDLGDLYASHALPEQWFVCLTDGMAEGNSIHNFVFSGTAVDLDIEDISNTLGQDMYIESYEPPKFISLLNGAGELIIEIENKLNDQEDCCGIMTMSGRTVALLSWATGYAAIFDSHQHPQDGALLGSSNDIKELAEWLLKCFRKYHSVQPQYCDLTWIKFDLT